MTPRAHAVTPAALAVSVSAVLTTLMVYAAMAYDVRLGFVLLAVMCFTILALLNLAWGVALWIPLGFIADSVPVVFTALTAGAAVLLIAWLGELRRLRNATPRAEGRRWLPLAAAALGFWLLLSLGWAEDPGIARPILVSWTCSLVVFFIIATTLTGERQVRLLATAFVCGAVLSVIVGVAREGLASAGELDTGFRSAGGADANLLAAALIPGLVLAAALFAVSRAVVARGLFLLAIAIMVFGIAQTQSRGAVIGSVVVLLAALVVARRQRIQILVATFAISAVAAAVFAVFPAALERMTTFDKTGTGRTELWGIAWDMARDHPVVGVGLANFPELSEQYARRPGGLQFVEDIVYRPHVVHNTYLSMLAEGGIIGTVLLLIVVLGAANAARRAARRFEAAGSGTLRTLALAVLLGAIGMLAADVFLSGGHDPRLWILLALGPALLAASRQPKHAVQPG
jgi:O-antigen ligase